MLQLAFLSLDHPEILPIVKQEIEDIQNGILFRESNENF